MNTTTRRIVTTVAGVSLAASAFAATGPAANAAGKTKTPTPISVFAGGAGPVGTNGPYDVIADYTVPVVPSAVISVSCALDGVQLTYCGDVFTPARKTTNYWGYVAHGQSFGEHTFSVTVVTQKATYAGSTVFVLDF